MKILVFSDTHHSTDECIDIIQNTPDVCAVIHAGDMVSDAEDMSCIFSEIPFYYVSGNNDIVSSAPMQRLIGVANKKIFITHGHGFGVKQATARLVSYAKSLGAHIVVFGHTHTCCDKFTDGIYLLNPGSMGYYPRTYATIDIINDEIYTKIINYN